MTTQLAIAQNNPLMLVLQERLKTMAINEMSDEDLKVFVDETFETFTKGSKSKRYQKNPRYSSSNGGYVVRTESGEPIYDLDPTYDPALDKDTLPGMIHIGLQDFAKKKMVEYLESEKFKTQWDMFTQTHKMNDNVLRSFLQQNATQILGEMMEKHLHAFLTVSLNQLKSSGRF